MKISKPHSLTLAEVDHPKPKSAKRELGRGYAGGQGNAPYTDVAFANGAGGAGGSSALGGAGGAAYASSAGGAGAANTGGGGAGGGGGGTNVFTGLGGGAGGYVEFILTSPSAHYDYVVGAGGAGGPLGTSGFPGGNGGSGYIEVTEYYQ